MRRAVRREGGQAVVEFALVLPLIAIFLLGMAQLGLALNARQQLEGVARQGARTYALTGDGLAAAAAVRLAGGQIAQFGARADLVIQVVSPTKGYRRWVSAGGAVAVLETSVDNAGTALRQWSVAAARRGDWVTIRLIYHYPNPVQASVFGFRLPAVIPLSTSASARVEADPSVRAQAGAIR